MDVFRMYWDVFYDVLRCILRCIEMYWHITQESKYLIQYIAIHLRISHNTSDKKTYINTSMMYWDVFNCQYMLNTRQFPAQYISSTSVIHPIYIKPQFEIHSSIDVWFIVNLPQIHLKYRVNTSRRFFSGTWLGLFTVVCALFGPPQQPNILGLELRLCRGPIWMPAQEWFLLQSTQLDMLECACPACKKGCLVLPCHGCPHLQEIT